MKRIGIEKVILDCFKEHRNSWVKKGDLYNLAYQYGYSPETLGRTLRTLEENGTLKVDYYDSKFAKGLAMYIYGGIPTLKTIYEEVEIDGERRMIAKQETVLV